MTAEVEYIDIEGRTLRKVPGHGDKLYEFGCLTEFAYPVENSGRFAGRERRRREDHRGHYAS